MPPDDLMDLDPAMVTSLLAALHDRQDAISERFTITEELLAQILEMLSIIRSEALIGRIKGNLPEMVHVPRPGRVEPVDTTPVMTPREFSLMMQVS